MGRLAAMRHRTYPKSALVSTPGRSDQHPIALVGPNPGSARHEHKNKHQMRILHVNERAGFYGGVEQILHDIASGLRALGHPQALLHTDPHPREDFLETFDESASGLLQTDELIHAFRPDALLIHRLADADAVERLAARAPAARMVHGHGLICPRGNKLFPISHRSCDRPVGIDCWTHLCVLQRRPPWLRLRAVAEHRRALRTHQGVRRFIVGSHWMRQALVGNGIEPERVRVLPPVPSSLATTSPQPPSDRPEILFVGPVIATKGVDLLLRALTKVSGPWHTTVIGTGDDIDACKALAKALDIAHCVTFTGWVHHEDLDDYYARAAVSVVPSRWPEPFGMVGIEAMARGRPVVGFAVGGIPDWLEHGVTGLLAPEADTDALGAHIQTLLQDKALAHRLGQQAAERVHERFQPDAFRSSLLQILAEAS